MGLSLSGAARGFCAHRMIPGMGSERRGVADTQGRRAGGSAMHHAHRKCVCLVCRVCVRFLVFLTEGGAVGWGGRGSKERTMVKAEAAGDTYR